MKWYGKMMNYTLKWYGYYAETVRLYKDAFIYLYKKTCSWLRQSVDNLFLKNMFYYLSLLSTAIILSACSKINPDETLQNYALNLIKPPHKHFQQYPGNRLHPSTYFTCSKYQNPCHSSKLFKESK